MYIYPSIYIYLYIYIYIYPLTVEILTPQILGISFCSDLSDFVLIFKFVNIQMHICQRWDSNADFVFFQNLLRPWIYLCTRVYTHTHLLFPNSPLCVSFAFGFPFVFSECFADKSQKKRKENIAHHSSTCLANSKFM